MQPEPASVPTEGLPGWLGTVAQTGLLGTLLVLALLAIYTQRKEITGLWSTLVADAKKFAADLTSLAADTRTAMQALSISNENRAASAAAVAATQATMADVLKSVASEVALIRQTVLEQSRDIDAILQKQDRCRSDMDDLLRRSDEGMKRLAEDLTRRIEARIERIGDP